MRLQQRRRRAAAWKVSTTTSFRTTVLLTTALLVLAACSGATDKATQVPQARKATAAERLAAAKVKADAATSMHLTLRSSGIPESVTGVLSADGSGTHAPAFKGTLVAQISGLAAKVEVVAIDRLLYLKLPFATEFVPADPKEYNAPDPARLFDTQGGITSLMTATANPVEAKQIRVGADLLTTITGKLPGDNVVKLLNFGDATKTYDVTYGITDPGGELRTVTVAGPFFKGLLSSYVLTLDKYGAPVEISKP